MGDWLASRREKEADEQRKYDLAALEKKISAQQPPGDAGLRGHHAAASPLLAWAAALRAVAWIWWVLGLIIVLAVASELGGSGGTIVALNVLLSLLGVALVGMLLYSFSHVMVAIGEIRDNTRPTLPGKQPVQGPEPETRGTSSHTPRTTEPSASADQSGERGPAD